MGNIVLVRHGQSQWNLENRFTGWVDVSITPKGAEEAHRAGRELKGVKFDLAFTSDLERVERRKIQPKCGLFWFPRRTSR